MLNNHDEEQMNYLHQKNVDSVRCLADALNAHDLGRARSYLADGLEFIGVFGAPLKGREAYLEAMGKLRANQNILKVVADETDVICFYELTLPHAPQNVILGCGWFTFDGDRIMRIRVVFDPTSLRKPG